MQILQFHVNKFNCHNDQLQKKKSLHDKNPIQNLAHRREHLEEVQKSKPTALQRAREVHKHTTLGNPHLVQFHLITKN